MKYFVSIYAAFKCYWNIHILILATVRHCNTINTDIPEKVIVICNSKKYEIQGTKKNQI